MINYFHAIITKIYNYMDKKGYTTESGGRQNGFALEPEMDIISEGESKKSIIIFLIIIICMFAGFVYYFKFY